MLHLPAKSRRGTESGFTMIELLVVVVIIAILAAIAVPVYLNVRNEAARSALKSDVNATVKKVGIALTQDVPLATIVANSADYVQGNNRGEKIYISPVDGSVTASTVSLNSKSYLKDGAFVVRSAVAHGKADGVAHAKLTVADNEQEFFVYGLLDKSQGAPVNYVYNYTSVNDKYSQNGSGDAVVNATPVAPTLSTTTLPDATIGKSYSASVVGSGTPVPVYKATGLPTGITMDPATGAIAGTTNDPAGNYPVKVTATNPVGVATQNMTLKLTSAAKVVINTGALDNAYSNAQYTSAPIDVTATDTTGTNVFEATGLPTGYSIDSATGVIKGTSTVTSSVTVTIKVTNGAATASKDLPFRVFAGAAPVLSAPVNNATYSGAMGTAITAIPVTVSGTPAPSISVTNLPAGLSFDAGQSKIVGTPTAVANNQAVTITVKNAVNPTGVTRTIYFNITGQLVYSNDFPRNGSDSNWSGAYNSIGCTGAGGDGYGMDGFGQNVYYQAKNLVVGSSYTMSFLSCQLSYVSVTQGGKTDAGYSFVVNQYSGSVTSYTFTATSTSATFNFNGSRGTLDNFRLYRNS